MQLGAQPSIVPCSSRVVTPNLGIGDRLPSKHNILKSANHLALWPSRAARPVSAVQQKREEFFTKNSVYSLSQTLVFNPSVVEQKFPSLTSYHTAKTNIKELFNLKTPERRPARQKGSADFGDLLCVPSLVNMDNAHSHSSQSDTQNKPMPLQVANDDKVATRIHSTSDDSGIN